MKTGQLLLKIGIFSLLFQLTYVFVIFAGISDFRKRANQSVEQYTEADVEAEVLFGRQLAAKILGRYPLLEDEQIQEYVSILGTGLVTQVGRPELKYYFAVIDTQDINAYACPGGYIFITKGALQSMTNEAQLVGVLAHEIIHVDQKHIVKQLKIKGKDKSITSGLSGVFGAGSASVRIALEQLADQAFKTLFEEGLSKGDELESDTMGVAILIDQGYDGQAYRDYVANLQMMIQGGQGEVLSKTHPTTSVRVASIEKTIEQKNPSAQTGKRNENRFAEYVQFQEILLASDFSDFDLETELIFGRDLAAKLIGKYKLLKNESVQKYVALLGTGIAAQMGTSEFKYNFAVLDTEEANVFAVPGGYIFVTKGTLRSMKDEAQLVGVLAQQMVHIDQKNLIKQLRVTGTKSKAVRVPLHTLTDKSLEILVNIGISEDYFLASNELALEIMVDLEYDWKSYLEYLAGLPLVAGQEGEKKASLKRLDALKKFIIQRRLNRHEGKRNSKRFNAYLSF